MSERPVVNKGDPSQISTIATEQLTVTKGMETNFTQTKWFHIFKIVLLLICLLAPIILFLFWFISKNKKLLQQYEGLQNENRMLREKLEDTEIKMQHPKPLSNSSGSSNSSNSCCLNKGSTASHQKKQPIHKSEKLDKKSLKRPKDQENMMHSIDLIMDPDGKIYAAEMGFVVNPNQQIYTSNQNPSSPKIKIIENDEDDESDDETESIKKHTKDAKDEIAMDAQETEGVDDQDDSGDLIFEDDPERTLGDTDADQHCAQNFENEEICDVEQECHETQDVNEFEEVTEGEDSENFGHVQKVKESKPQTRRSARNVDQSKNKQNK